MSDFSRTVPRPTETRRREFRLPIADEPGIALSPSGQRSQVTAAVGSDQTSCQKKNKLQEHESAASEILVETEHDPATLMERAEHLQRQLHESRRGGR